ncbi:MAG: DNA repair protein RadC, partial [Pseudomonadota bacterium]
ALPRRDTKNLAKELIKKFGSFAKVVTAEEEALLEVNGIGNTALSCFRLTKEASLRLIKEELNNKPVLSSWQSVLNYSRVLIGHANKEMFVVFYLNNQNILIAEDIYDYGTVDQVSIYPREIAKRALFLNASAIILAHNHPSGETKPSKSDVEMTNNINTVLKTFNIRLHDHVIISDKNFYSFKTAGLL